MSLPLPVFDSLRKPTDAVSSLTGGCLSSEFAHVAAEMPVSVNIGEERGGSCWQISVG